MGLIIFVWLGGRGMAYVPKKIECQPLGVSNDVSCGGCIHFSLQLMTMSAHHGYCSKIFIQVDHTDWCNNPCLFEAADMAPPP